MVICVILCAVWSVTFVYASWENEFSADAGAAKVVGNETVVSLLRELVPAEKQAQESEMHPSVRERVSRLGTVGSRLRRGR